MSLRSLGSRADVLSATAGHPYARFATATGADATGVAGDRAALWVCQTPFGRLGHALGPIDAVTALLERAGDLVDGTYWINLPRHGQAQRPTGYALNEDWDLRWCTALPPTQAGEELAEELTDDHAGEVNALLDLVMPATAVRPGHDLVRRFYGIRQDSSLVACGADRSAAAAHEPGRGVGVVGAIAVHPDHRRRGLGAAITTAVTRRLAAAHPLVVLGQAADNDTATRLYPRLGYTGVQHMTSVRST